MRRGKTAQPRVLNLYLFCEGKTEVNYFKEIIVNWGSPGSFILSPLSFKVTPNAYWKTLWRGLRNRVASCGRALVSMRGFGLSVMTMGAPRPLPAFARP